MSLTCRLFGHRRRTRQEATFAAPLNFCHLRVEISERVSNIPIIWNVEYCARCGKELGRYIEPPMHPNCQCQIFDFSKGEPK